MNSVEDLDQETSKFLAVFEDYVTRVWGDRCEDFAMGCPCCDAWALFDQCKAKFTFIE
jgi:hypothetical protein